MDARLPAWASHCALMAEDAHARAAWFVALADRERPGSAGWLAAVSAIGRNDRLAALWEDSRLEAEAAMSAGAG